MIFFLGESNVFRNFGELLINDIFLACGGEIHAVSGRFSSPNYPESYPASTECVWIMGGSPGNRVSMNFIFFDIEDSDNCNRDYVEVHADNAGGRDGFQMAQNKRLLVTF